MQTYLKEEVLAEYEASNSIPATSRALLEEDRNSLISNSLRIKVLEVERNYSRETRSPSPRSRHGNLQEEEKFAHAHRREPSDVRGASGQFEQSEQPSHAKSLRDKLQKKAQESKKFKLYESHESDPQDPAENEEAKKEGRGEEKNQDRHEQQLTIQELPPISDKKKIYVRYQFYSYLN